MGETTAISWCDHTFNPWWGCIEVTPACDWCYAREFAKRLGMGLWGPDASRRYFGAAHWNEPRKWDRAAAAAGVRRRVFCASMADVFERHPDFDENQNLNNQRLKLWNLIAETPNLDWLLLTKRPQNIIDMVPGAWVLDGFPRNVWIGFTAEAQREFDIRWRDVRSAADRAAVVFVSYEPALGPLVLPESFLSRRASAWVIGGGESGRHARPSHPDWFRSLRDQCAVAGVAFHFKQWGEWLPSGQVIDHPFESEAEAGRFFGRVHEETFWADTKTPRRMLRAGKKIAGRLLDEVEWNHFPEVRS